jgi:hypothetical protein
MLAPSRDDLRADQQGGVSLWYIARRAGFSNRSGAWMVNYVRQLIARDHFPAPLPYYGLNERKREGLGLHSRWNRLAVDAWFDGFIPPHLVPVANDRQAGRDAGLLDQRAVELATAASAAR